MKTVSLVLDKNLYDWVIRYGIEHEMNISQLIRLSLKRHTKFPSAVAEPEVKPEPVKPQLDPTEVLASGWTRAELDAIAYKPLAPAVPIALRPNTVSPATIEKLAADWADD